MRGYELLEKMELIHADYVMAANEGAYQKERWCEKMVADSGLPLPHILSYRAVMAASILLFMKCCMLFRRHRTVFQTRADVLRR